MLQTPAEQDLVSRGRQVAIGGLTLLLLVLLLTLLFGGEQAVPVPTVPTTEAGTTTQPTDGQQLYALNCASCHGANREGAAAGGDHAAPPLNQTSPARTQSDDWLLRTIRDGGQATAPAGETNFMPAMGGQLSDDQIRAIIAYLRAEGMTP